MITEKIRGSVNPTTRLVLPLDFPDKARALELVRTLSGQVGFFKVGLELYLSEGPSILAQIKEIDPDAGLFLDLKLHDIPATVGRAMEAARKYSPDLITIHTQGGLEMMKAAVENSGGVAVLGVTVLTSLDPSSLDELSDEYRKPGLYAARLAQRALIAGCEGLVCSSLETADLRNRFGQAPLLVTPGIRPDWSLVKGDDQKRIGTVSSALTGGSDLLVIGRPIRDAPDPLEACQRVLEEISLALSDLKDDLEPQD
ncbi:MAG: orotidine-5'-phosphate decarboxylase [Deltaproteobacteria bacterium]|nr:orotidine-5'-phosphate decarboxylase [Deltaproteobacteria bacterium]